MRRPGALLALSLAVMMALAPAMAFARTGGGLSMGSRGSRTYSPPPATSTAPSVAAPMQRTMTPNAPSVAPQPASPGLAGGAGMATAGRSPFMSGLMGGLIGAGIGGLLFGGGLFHGIDGMGGFLGLLLQIFLVALLGRWLFRRFLSGRQPAFASAGPAPAASMFARDSRSATMGGGGARPARKVAIAQADFAAFEQLLRAVQAAWSAHDLATMRRVATPEMASYFAEQMGEQTSRGVRNVVEHVRLQQGDLAEAWAEEGREYATVAMRFSMTDVTLDSTGRVVDGDPNEQVEATEIWTFLRAAGGNWVLSAIQQAG